MSLATLDALLDTSDRESAPSHYRLHSMPDFLIPELAALRASADTLIAELGEIAAGGEIAAEEGDGAAGPGSAAAERVRQRSRDLGLYGMTQPSELLRLNLAKGCLELGKGRL